MEFKEKYVVAGIATVALVMSMLYAKPLGGQKPATKKNSIVRLHDQQGRFFCSGTVISRRIVLTAAHCISGSPLPGLLPDTLDATPIMVVPNGERIGVWGRALAANERADVGVIVGNFDDFDVTPIETDSLAVYRVFTLEAVNTCGFPWGTESLRCFKMTNFQKYYFYWGSQDGALLPGMSGGPVFSNDGKIVGVVSAVGERENILVPISELEAMLGIRL